MVLLKWVKSLIGGQGYAGPADNLYIVLVKAARQPRFYNDPINVPDTLDGRFDMIVLHLCLMVHLLSARGENDLARALQEVFIQDMDRSMREMGVGDMSVGKRIKDIGAALFGRQKAYSAALDASDPKDALANAIEKNVFRRDGTPGEGALQLADYILTLESDLKALSPSDIHKSLLVSQNKD